MESAIGKEFESNQLLSRQAQNVSSLNAPACTGSGTDVENVNSLLYSIQSLVSNPEKLSNNKDSSPQDPQHHENDLNNFETFSKGTIKMEEDNDLMEEKRRLKEMDDFATDVATRASILRDGVLGLLRIVAGNASSANIDSSSTPVLKEQVARLESELKMSESKLEEMANARNEAAASERRVRRGLYRLAGGRMTIEEVLKAVEKEDNGVSFMETLAMIDGMNNKNVSSPDGTAVVSSSDAGAMSSPAFSSSAGAAGGPKDASSPANSEEVAQLKKSLQDVQVIAETRDKKITELLTEREQQLRRINSLLLSSDGGGESPGEDTIRNSPLYIEAMAKLSTSERRVKELESAHEKIMEKWAAVKGDLELAKKTLADMEEKQNRRWAELIAQFSDADLSSNAAATVDTNGSTDVFGNAKKTAELESKLQQAMEAVSRMETLRSTLADSYKMNEQLQSKLEDLRTKNAKMVAEKVAQREKSKESESTDSLTSPHGSSKRSSSGGDPAFDKLQRDYRRARKEVSAAVLSKDQAKLKQERAEKERDALMKTNARLLKQSSDKDDMNAKSLSTILHLKQRNEELEKENAIIKEEAKAAQQLSLAARLASNAKDRVGEEALKEKELLDEKVKELQKECHSLRNEKDRAENLLAQSDAKTSLITKDLDTARARCDELVSETNKKEEEKKQMVESLAVVKKEATESAMKAAAASGDPNGAASAFTMDQMTTQVKYLSGRINCPVCNVREKKCILLRCRHMFCQQCVDVNIKNRSRKCPACAQRFDMKDVAEIWL
jgi:E3 ubiquitin-protein ligase BRE1